MKKARVIGLVAAILFIPAAGMALAEVPSNQKIPFNDSFFAPCANRGVRPAGMLRGLLARSSACRARDPRIAVADHAARRMGRMSQHDRA